MRVIFVSYNGMARRLFQGDRHECHEYAKGFRERRERQDYDVLPVSPNEWECQKRNPIVIGDNDGWLKVTGDAALAREYGERT